MKWNLRPESLRQRFQKGVLLPIITEKPRAFKMVLASEFGELQLGWKEVKKQKANESGVFTFWDSGISRGFICLGGMCVPFAWFLFRRIKKGIVWAAGLTLEVWTWRQHRMVGKASGIQASGLTLGRWWNLPAPPSPQLESREIVLEWAFNTRD